MISVGNSLPSGLLWRGRFIYVKSWIIAFGWNLFSEEKEKNRKFPFSSRWSKGTDLKPKSSLKKISAEKAPCQTANGSSELPRPWHICYRDLPTAPDLHRICLSTFSNLAQHCRLLSLFESPVWEKLAALSAGDEQVCLLICRGQQKRGAEITRFAAQPEPSQRQLWGSAQTQIEGIKQKGSTFL